MVLYSSNIVDTPAIHLGFDPKEVQLQIDFSSLKATTLGKTAVKLRTRSKFLDHIWEPTHTSRA